MTKLPEKNVLDGSKLPKTTAEEMKGSLIAFEPDMTGGKSIIGASCNTDIPVAFIEQRNQSIYGSDVNDIECGRKTIAKI